jgi:hypothetical protein
MDVARPPHGDAERLVLGQRQLVDQFEKPGWRLLS